MQRELGALTSYDEAYYDWGWNTCQDYPEFKVHGKEPGSFMDAWTAKKEEMQE